MFPGDGPGKLSDRGALMPGFFNTAGELVRFGNSRHWRRDNNSKVCAVIVAKLARKWPVGINSRYTGQPGFRKCYRVHFEVTTSGAF